MDYSVKNKSYNSAISLVSASNSFEMNVMGITSYKGAEEYNFHQFFFVFSDIS